jgi:hypothetical protein
VIYKTLRRKLKIEHYKSNYMCSGMVRGSCLASGVTLVFLRRVVPIVVGGYINYDVLHVFLASQGVRQYNHPQQ